jgi:hypothetical protein
MTQRCQWHNSVLCKLWFVWITVWMMLPWFDLAASTTLPSFYSVVSVILLSDILTLPTLAEQIRYPTWSISVAESIRYPNYQIMNPDIQTIRHWTYQRPDRTIQTKTHQIRNLSDTKPIRYGPYQILNLPDYKPLRCQTYQIPSLSYTKFHHSNRQEFLLVILGC